MSALILLSTRTYSESDSPSLGPGVGGRSPGAYLPPSLFLNSADRGLVGCSLNVSPNGTRCRGLDLPDDFPGGLPVAAIFNLSSVAFNLASRASSSEVWVETAFFLGEGQNTIAEENEESHFSETAASKSAMLLSILKRSLRARENDLAIVLKLSAVSECQDEATHDCGLLLGFHSRSISSSDIFK